MAESRALEGTFAMIKPDAVDRAGLIFTRIVKEDFMVVEQQRFRFSTELAELFYIEHRGRPYFDNLIQYITSGPVIGMVLARKDGLNHWLRVLGPKKPSDARTKSPNSIRSLYGSQSNDLFNACHGSDSPSKAEREIEIIFPHILQQDQQQQKRRPETADSAMINGHTSVPIQNKNVFSGHANIPELNESGNNAEFEMTKAVMSIKDLDNKSYLQQYVVPTLLKGLSEMYEVRPQSPIDWLADWLQENNPFKE